MGTAELPLWSAAISAAGALVGALIGGAAVYIAQRQTNSWEREWWRLDQKYAEYRSMLSASGALGWALQKEGTNLAEPGDLPTADHAAHSAVASWVFTNNAVIESGLVEQLADLTRELAGASPGREVALRHWFQFHANLRRVAQKDLGLRPDPKPAVAARAGG